MARLRTVARRAKVNDIGVQGKFVRFGPVELRESQQMRLMRLYPGTLVKEPQRQLLVPAPMTAKVGGKVLRDDEILRWASDLMQSVLLDDIATAAGVQGRS